MNAGQTRRNFLRGLLAGVAVLSVACKTDAIPVHTSFEPSPEMVEIIDEGAAILGYDVEYYSGDTSYGTVHIDLVDINDLDGDAVYGNIGHANDMSNCTGSMWAKDDPEIVAHELAHVLGLDDIDDCESEDRRLMCGRRDGPEEYGRFELSDDDQATMDRHVGRLWACIQPDE